MKGREGGREVTSCYITCVVGGRGPELDRGCCNHKDLYSSIAVCSLQIYVVMERMNGDMLEMILSSPNSKLDERITKFMIYQVRSSRPFHTSD